MAFHVEHTYSTHVEISYLDSIGNYALKENQCGNMDDLAEHMREVIIKHNFTHADACDANTGELVLTVERT